MPDPGLWNVQGSSDLWTNAGSQAERALTYGWLADQNINSTGGFATNAQPSTATAFLSTGDGTTGSGNSFYAIGRRLRVVHAGGTTYCEVTAASLAAGQTTVTVGRITSGATSLSTVSITTVHAGPTYASTDWNTPFPFRWGSFALSTAGHLRPEADNTYNLGSTDLRLSFAYVTNALTFSNSTVAVGLIRSPSISGGAITLIAGTTGLGDLGLLQFSGTGSMNLYDANGSATRAIRTNSADGTGHVAANSLVWQTT